MSEWTKKRHTNLRESINVNSEEFACDSLHVAASWVNDMLDHIEKLEAERDEAVGLLRVLRNPPAGSFESTVEQWNVFLARMEGAGEREEQDDG